MRYNMILIIAKYTLKTCKKRKSYSRKKSQQNKKIIKIRTKYLIRNYGNSILYL